MARSNHNLTPDRLTEAADAALRAALDHAKRRRGIAPYPADLMETPAEPACLLPFSKEEVREACEFLIRLGVFQRPRAKRAA